MTSLDSTMTTVVPRPRTSTPRRRAFRFEHRCLRMLIAFCGIFAVAVLSLSLLADIHVGFLLILMAARLPADIGRHGGEQERLLRSSLGISRADAVRTHFWMVLLCQLPLVVAAAWSILAREYGADETHWSTFSYSPGPSTPVLSDHLVDIGLWVAAILWVHALLGGEASRLGRGPSSSRAIALFLGVCILEWLILVATWLVIDVAVLRSSVDMATMSAVSRTAQWITVALSLTSGIVVLWRARRRWIREA